MVNVSRWGLRWMRFARGGAPVAGLAVLFALSPFAAAPVSAQGACGRALLLEGGPPRTIAEANQREAVRRECERERASAQSSQKAAQARMAARGAWAEAPAAFRVCLEGQLARFGVTMDALIQQDVFLGDPYLAELEEFCRAR
jgi:hypothetical protein